MKITGMVSMAFLLSCNRTAPPVQQVKVHIRGAAGKTIYLEELPFNGAGIAFKDSAIAQHDRDSLVFSLPFTGERILRVRAPEVNMDILLATDQPVVEVHANYGNTNAWHFTHSPASSFIQQFMRSQDSIAYLMSRDQEKTDSLRRASGDSSQAKRSKDRSGDYLRLLYDRYKTVEDTVTDPAVFMLFYNQLDFGNNYAALKKFILRAGQRFPSDPGVRELVSATVSFVKIFEEEYQPGDVLPGISLPDVSGNVFNTASLKGKYYLLDFWSPWCPQCLAFNNPKRQLYNSLDHAHFDMVSIALDDQRAGWAQMIGHGKLDWHQLIDEKMWKGKTVQRFKIDSIPFNFLVSPEGIVLKKAIAADSLVRTVMKLVKK